MGKASKNIYISGTTKIPILTILNQPIGILCAILIAYGTKYLLHIKDFS